MQSRVYGVSTPKNSRLGFSLVELMTVIAIVAILIAMIAPTYKDYIVRRNIANVFPYTQEIKLDIAEQKANGRVYGEQITDVIALADTNKPFGVDRIFVGHYGMIEIYLALDEIGLDSDGGSRVMVLLMIPTMNDGNITWACKYHPTNHYADYIKYLPLDCQDPSPSSDTSF